MHDFCMLHLKGTSRNLAINGSFNLINFLNLWFHLNEDCNCAYGSKLEKKPVYWTRNQFYWTRNSFDSACNHFRPISNSGDIKRLFYYLFQNENTIFSVYRNPFKMRARVEGEETSDTATNDWCFDVSTNKVISFKA